MSLSQVRSDWYVYVILSALPWVVSELQERKRGDFERLLTALEHYMRWVTPSIIIVALVTTSYIAIFLALYIQVM